jgi:hypothetical protein
MFDRLTGAFKRSGNVAENEMTEDNGDDFAEQTPGK